VLYPLGQIEPRLLCLMDGLRPLLISRIQTVQLAGVCAGDCIDRRNEFLKLHRSWDACPSPQALQAIGHRESAAGFNDEWRLFNCCLSRDLLRFVET